MATKQLLETLTQWSRHNATEAEVSDVYVRLGYEFNIASRAFNAIGVDTSDLGNVPDLLRSILEDTLSQEASPASLDRYLPRIRDIIINLLHGLKRKQQKLRQRQAKDENSPTTARQDSMSSAGTGETGLTQMLDEQSMRFAPSSQGMGRSTSKENNFQDESGVPPRMSSSHGGRASPLGPDPMNQPNNRPRPGTSDRSRQPSTLNTSSSSISSNTMQNMPVIAPYQQDDARPGHRDPPSEASPSTFPAPPPPPKQQDALAALQRGGDLERRASRRYSAYQISKHLGGAANGMPMLPPAQHSPIPNRGRELRESLTAVRIRGSYLQSEARSKDRSGTETSPNRRLDTSRQESDDGRQGSATSMARPSEDQALAYSPLAKTPDDKLGPSLPGPDGPITGATLNGPPINDMPVAGTELDGDTLDSPHGARGEPMRRNLSQADKYMTTSTSTPEVRQFIPEQSPQPGKELTLFLQYKSKIKKFVLPDGANALSVARLQLAFIEKFAWNTHSNGIDLPEIYIQDPVSGVRHELEDLSDVKDRSVLVLNVEVLDEVKKHIDEGLGGLRRMVEGVRGVVDGQQTTIKQVSDRQIDAAKAMSRMGPATSADSTRPARLDRPMINGVRNISATLESPGSLSDIQNLRRDLAVMRQTYSSFVTDVESSMSDIRTKASSVKTVAIHTAIPTLDGESGRAYVNKGKKEVGEVSDGLVNKVDDLQDIVEDLRKDVVTRGVRPLPRQLENVGRDISNATAELKKMQEFLRREKPKWSKIWEKELQVVCDDRDLLTMQEALAADLQDDLDNAAQTFTLVEEATKEQMKDGQPGATTRSTSRGLTAIVVNSAGDPHTAKEGVLGEVRALQPNHENRLEAIERAEKARQKELESRRGGEFQKELGSFVEEGRLKKSGGVEEAERLRKAKDERSRREVWERQEARAKAKEAKAKEAKEAKEAEGNAVPGSSASGDASVTGIWIQTDDGTATAPQSAEQSEKADGRRSGEDGEHSRPAAAAWPEMLTG